MIDLTKLSPADLAYLELCVSAGRTLRRGKRDRTQFAKSWLRGYANEHTGVWYDEKRRCLRYYWLENDVEQLCLDR